MNIHDQRRKNALIQTLHKARAQVETARMYLVANQRDPKDLAAILDALDHIELALERLSATVPTA
ncbi:MAG: hypothetical protein ACYCYO_02105 [Bacilli bacterium]